MGHKNISNTQQRKERKRRRENNVCGPKQIPGFAPTRAGSRPLNQRHCLEGAPPIKQILKECFIQNTSPRYFVPSSGVIDFLQVISLQRSVHYTAHFVARALWCFWWFEILLGPAVNRTEPFVLLLFHWCDMWPNALYRWISVMSPRWQRTGDKTGLGATKWNLLWWMLKLFTLFKRRPKEVSAVPCTNEKLLRGRIVNKNYCFRDAWSVVRGVPLLFCSSKATNAFSWIISRE